jgi:type IX secretion system PorP/SprF family membrane protein
MKITLIFIFLAVAQFSLAQQDPMFTHYMFNTLAINPGYAGSRDALTVTFLDRMQWTGFDGAPKTQTLTMHSPLWVKNTGIGLSVINDKIGPTNNTSFYADFSYKIKISTRSHLAFGFKAGMNIMKNDLADLKLQDQQDPEFQNNIRSNFLPNFGFGLYYYSDKYYIGASIPKLLENNFKENSVSGSVNLGSEAKHYFLIGGYLYKINEDFKLKPTTFIKITKAAPIEMDFSGQLLYKDRVWAGAMYRTGDAVGILVGAYVTQSLAIGYSYDWSYTNRSFKYNGGSHEILLQYDFVFKEQQKIRSPRYF